MKTIDINEKRKQQNIQINTLSRISNQYNKSKIFEKSIQFSNVFDTTCEYFPKRFDQHYRSSLSLFLLLFTYFFLGLYRFYIKSFSRTLNNITHTRCNFYFLTLLFIVIFILNTLKSLSQRQHIQYYNVRCIFTSEI